MSLSNRGRAAQSQLGCGAESRRGARFVSHLPSPHRGRGAGSEGGTSPDSPRRRASRVGRLPAAARGELVEPGGGGILL